MFYYSSGRLNVWYSPTIGEFFEGRNGEVNAILKSISVLNGTSSMKLPPLGALIVHQQDLLKSNLNF